MSLPVFDCGVNILQRFGIAQVLRLDFQDDVVLVDAFVDVGNLALAECVVQCVVDLRDRNAETSAVSRSITSWPVSR